MTLRVILQIVQRGDEDNIREIGRLDINNTGYIESVSDICRYQVIDLTKDQAGEFSNPVFHSRKDGAWNLVKTVIEFLLN